MKLSKGGKTESPEWDDRSIVDEQWWPRLGSRFLWWEATGCRPHCSPHQCPPWGLHSDGLLLLDVGLICWTCKTHCHHQRALHNHNYWGHVVKFLGETWSPKGLMSKSPDSLWLHVKEDSAWEGGSIISCVIIIKIRGVEEVETFQSTLHCQTEAWWTAPMGRYPTLRRNNNLHSRLRSKEGL